MRVLSLSKFSIIKPWSFLAVSGAFPLTMPGVFSKAAAVVSKLPLYSSSSFYGPLLSTYITPVLAVVSVVSTPLSMEISVPSFRIAGMHSVVAPVDTLLDTVVDTSVTPAKAGAQGHTHVLDTRMVVPHMSGSLPSQGRQQGVRRRQEGTSGGYDGEKIGVIANGVSVLPVAKPFVLSMTNTSSFVASALAGTENIFQIAPISNLLSSSIATSIVSIMTMNQMEAVEKLDRSINELEKKDQHPSQTADRPYVRALEDAIYLFKRIPSALRKCGITPDFFDNNNWMNFKHVEITSKQADDIIEGVVRYFLSKCKDLINCVPCQRSDEKTELNPDFIEKFISRIDKQSYYVEPTRKALRFLVGERIISEDYMDNVIKTYSI